MDHFQMKYGRITVSAIIMLAFISLLATRVLTAQTPASKPVDAKPAGKSSTKPAEAKSDAGKAPAPQPEAPKAPAAPDKADKPPVAQPDAGTMPVPHADKAAPDKPDSGKSDKGKSEAGKASAAQASAEEPDAEIERLRELARASTQPRAPGTAPVIVPPARPAPRATTAPAPGSSIPSVVRPGQPLANRPAGAPASKFVVTPDASGKQGINVAPGVSGSGKMPHDKSAAVHTANGPAVDPHNAGMVTFPPSGPAGQPAGNDASHEQPAAQTPAATSGRGEANAASEPASQPTTGESLLELFKKNQDSPETRTYRFAYVNEPWPKVLEDFARHSKLPLIGDLSGLTDTLTYTSPRELTFVEALDKLNDLLLTRPGTYEKYLMLKRDEVLRVNKLPDWSTRDIPVDRMYNSWSEFVAAGLPKHEIAQVLYEAPDGWTNPQLNDEFRTYFSDAFSIGELGGKIKLVGMAMDIRNYDEVIRKLYPVGSPDQLIRETRVFTLRNIRPSEAQSIMSSVIPTTSVPGANRGAPGQPGAAPDAQSVVAGTINYFPDDRNFTLTVVAVPSKLEVIARMLDEFEKRPILAEARRETYTPVHVSPEELIETVDMIRGAGPSTGGGSAAPLQPGMPNAGRKPGGTAVGGAASPREEEEQFDMFVLPGTSNVMIVGQPKGIDRARSLIAIADVAGVKPVRDTVALKYRDANDVIQLAALMFPKLVTTGPGLGAPPAGGGRFPPQPGGQINRGASQARLQLLPDMATNAIIMVGRLADMKDVKDFIADLDKPIDRVSEHYYTAKAAKPSDLAEMLTRIESVGGGTASKRGLRGSIGGVAKPGMPNMPGQAPGASQRLIANDQANRLIIVCDEDDWKIYQELLKELDTGEVKLHQFALKDADAGEMVTMLNSIYSASGGGAMPQMPGNPAMNQMRRPGRGSMAFIPDSRTNSVLVYATDIEVQPIKQLIAELDLPPNVKVTMLRLEHADACEVSQNLSQVYQSRSQLRRANAAGGGPVNRMGPPGAAPAGGGGASDVRVVCEPMTNSLLITANAADTEEVRRLAMDMDKANENAVIPLKHASATELATTIASIVGATTNAGRAMPQPGMPPGAQQRQRITTRINAEPQGNSLIVSAPTNDLAKIRSLVQLLDKEDLAKLHTVVLKVAPATDVAQTLIETFGGRRPAGGPQLTPSASADDVQVTPEPKTNTLVIRAGKAIYDQMLVMIKSLDVPELWEDTILPVKHVTPQEAVQRLTAIFMNRDGGGAAPAAGAPGAPRQRGGSGFISIVPAPSQKAILVRASKPDLERIKRGLEMIDDEAGTTLKLVIAVQNRVATDLAETIRGVFNGTGGARGNVPGAPPTGGTNRASTETPLQVLADNGQIILNGLRSDVLSAVEMINRLDQLPPADLFKVFTVSDAETVATTLNGLLLGAAARPPQAGTSATGDSGAITIGGGANPGGGQGRGGAANEKALTINDIRIHADSYRSLIFVTAPPSKMPIIEDWIKQIENPAGTSLTDAGTNDDGSTIGSGFHVFPLKYREAYDITGSLEELFAPTGPGRPAVRGAPSFKTGPDNYTLVVQCKPREWPLIEDMIKKFDRPEKTTAGLMSSELITVQGLTPSQLAALLKPQFGEKVKIDTSLSGREYTETIHLHPEKTDPAASQPGGQPFTPYVLPMSFQQALASALAGQTPPDATTTQPAKPTPANEEEDPDANVPVILIPDDRTGTMQLYGPPGKLVDVQKQIEDMLEDQQAATLIKFYVLAYADVNYASQLLNQIFNEQQAVQAPQPGQQPGQPQPQPGQPAAQPGQAPGGRAPAAPAAGGRNGRAGGSGAARGGARLRVVPDTRGKQLLVRASATDFPIITEILRSIDVDSKQQTQYKIFPLKNLDARDTADRVREVVFGTNRQNRSAAGRNVNFGGPPGQPGQPGQPQQPNPQPQPGQPGQPAMAGQANEETTTITADQQTNSVIVVAEDSTMQFIEKFINDLENRVNEEKATTEFIKLERARVTEVVNVLTPILRAEGQGGGGGGQPGQPGQPGGGGGGGGGRRGRISVTVSPDTKSNSVIAVGPRKDIERVRELVKMLDTTPDLETQTYVVKGDAAAYEKSLTKLFATPTAGGGPGANQGNTASDVVILGDAGTGTVTAMASRPMHEKIKLQIDQWELKIADTNKIRSIQLTIADAEKIAQSLEKVYQQRGQNRGNNQQVKITGVNGSKTIFVTAPDEIFKDIEEQVRLMDKNMDLDIKRYPLKKAVASEVIKRFDELMTKLIAASKLMGGGSDLGIKTFSYTADPITNSVLVTGEPLAFKVAESIIKELDVDPDNIISRVLRAYPLSKMLNAQIVVGNITQLFTGRNAQGSEPPSVTAEPATNIVFVTANEKQHEEIKSKIIDPMLKEAESMNTQTHTIPLKFARAEDLKPTLDEHFRGWLASRGNKLSDTISISTDPNTNQLIVLATPTSKVEFDARLAALDVQAVIDFKRRQERISIKFANPQSIQQTVQTAFGKTGRVSEREKVDVTVEPSTNAVVVTASPELMGQVKELIAKMDIDPQTEGGRKPHYVQLANAKASDLANTLRQWVQNTFRATAAGVWPIVIVNDDPTNSLIVTANDIDFKQAMDAITKLDVAPDMPTPRRFPIKFADPSAVVQAVQTTFAARSKTPQDQVQVTFDWGTASLVVTANSRNMTQVEALVKEMDVDTGAAKTNHFVTLAHGKADDVARVLNEVVRNTYKPDKLGRMEVVVTPDPTTNKLLVMASAENFAKIEEMIKAVDVDAGEMQTRTFVVQYADPGSMQTIIRDQFQNVRSQNPGDRVTAGFDAGTRTLVVTANARNMAMVEALVKSVDIEGLGMQTEIITLKNANARDVSQAVTTMYQNSRRTSGTGQKPASFTHVQNTTQIIVTAEKREMIEAKRLVEQLDSAPSMGGRVTRVVTMPEHIKAKDVAQNVTKMYATPGGGNDSIRAEANEPTNTMLVFSTDAEFERMNKELIEPLCKQKAIADTELYQVRLVSAVATDVAKTLNEFFKERSGGGGNRGFDDFFFFGGGNSEKKEEKKTTITADAQSNTLIISCTPSVKEKLIDPLLKTIDSDEGSRDREMQTFTLRYMEAEAVKNILQEFLRVNVRTEDPNANLPRWERRFVDPKDREDKATLVGDTRLTVVESLNMLVVASKRETMEKVRQKIDELDKPGAVSGVEQLALKVARAATIVQTLQKMFVEGESGAQSKSQIKTKIVADEGSNSVMVKATPTVLTQIKDVIKTLDTELSLTSVAVSVVPVPMSFDVREVASNIESLLNAGEQNIQKRNKEYSPSLVSIKPDSRTNTLLVSASPEKLKDVNSLVANLGNIRPSTGQSVSLIKVTNIKVEDAQKMIEQMRKARDSNRRGDAGWGRDRDLRQQLNRDASGTAVALPFLQSAMLGIMASAALAQTPATQPGVIRIAPQDAPTAAAAPAASQPAVAAGIGYELSGGPLTVQVVGGNLIVLGAKEDVDIINALIAAADQAVPKVTEFIPLRNAQAKEIQKSVKDVFDNLGKKPGLTQPREEERVDVIADNRSNSLIVVATAERMSVARTLIEQIDGKTSDAGKALRAFPLNNRLAKEAKTVLDEIVKNLIKRVGGDAGQISVTVDEPGNTIFVVGGEKDLVEIEGVIKTIDMKPGETPAGEPRRSSIGAADIMFYPLRVAEAEPLGALITKLLGDAKTGKTALGQFIRELRILDDNGNPIVELNLDKPIFAYGDKGTNSLIMGGPADTLKVMRKVVERLDVDAVREAVEYTTITLRHANPVDLADTIKKISEDGKKVTASPGDAKARPGFPAGAPGLAYSMVVIPDARTNTLFVAANKETLKLVLEYVANVDRPGVPLMPVEIVQLKNAAAVDVEKVLTDTIKARQDAMPKGGANATKPHEIVVKPDGRTNALLVSALAEDMAEVKRLISQLDVEVTLGGQIELFVLKHVSSSVMKTAITDLFSEDIYRPGAGADDSKSAEAQKKVTAISDDRGNTLIVSASPANMSLVKQLVARMDQPAAWTPVGLEIYDLKFAEATKIAAILTDYFDKSKESEESGDRKNVVVPATIFADERTNRLVVSADPAGQQKVQSLLKTLDVKAGEPTQTFQVYPLVETSAARLEPVITKLFEERSQGRQGGNSGANVPESVVTIQADDISNTLVVSANRDDQALISNLIRMLDRRSNVIERVQMFPLTKAKAEDMKERLEELYKGGGTGGTGGGAAGGSPITITADPRLNAIVVVGPPGELAAISSLVRQLDGTDPGMQSTLRIIRLDNADASSMSDLLKELMGAGGGTGSATTGTGDAAMLISYFDRDPVGRDIFFKSIRENVQVWADERTNSVLVLGPPQTVELIEAIVKNLDQMRKKEVLVKLFPLRNADAEKTVEVLEKVFAQDEGSSQQEDFQEGRDIQVSGGSTGSTGPMAESQGPAGSKGLFGKPKTVFVRDSRTNAVIVGGWEEDIVVAADIIHQLDAQDIQEREALVIPVNNIKVEDVQSALDTYFQQEKEIISGSEDSISEQAKRDQEVSVVAHEETNKLIVSVSPRKRSAVEELIRQLDTPTPQVLIQVLLAQVTLDDSLEMGLEWNLQQLRFSEQATQGPNGTIVGPGFDVVGGTDLGAAGSGSLGGLSFTITGEDFNFLFHALQSQGKLEIMQRPSLMVRNNEDANISVGQNVPFVQGTGTTTTGNPTADIQYEEVGIKLDVTPTINPDGWVYLHVAPEISSITDSSVPLGNGIAAPIFNKQSADTYVVVKDGETVIIGGLIVDQIRESENKIPILGDLPGAQFIGAKTIRTTKSRNELLIVLTPRIVRTVEDARAISIEERNLSRITPQMKQSPLMARLREVPETAELSDDEIPDDAELIDIDDSADGPSQFNQADINWGDDVEPPPAMPVPSTPRRSNGGAAPQYGPVSAPQYGPVLPSPGASSGAIKGSIPGKNGATARNINGANGYKSSGARPTQAPARPYDARPQTSARPNVKKDENAQWVPIDVRQK